MRLQSQLNWAFTVLLLVILAVTGYVIYSMILGMLIDNERAELEQKGELLVQVLNEQYQSQQSIEDFQKFLKDQDLQLFLYDRQHDDVLLATMPRQYVKSFSAEHYFANDREDLWEAGSKKFVTSRILLSPDRTALELILLTPLTDLQIVQKDFFRRLLIVFLVGTIAAVLLSYLLTRKLATPLTQLKKQLKKIEKRQFDDVERVRATGEIKEVEQSVYDMATELERYMTSQQAFFQNASHELKTPLMTIQGYAEGIRDNIFDEEAKEQGLELMVSEVNRLKTIINDMILLAKLDTDQTAYQSEQIRAKDIIDQVKNRALPLVREHDIDLVCHVNDDSTFLADSEKFLQALLNITVNAIRHAYGQVTITVENQVFTIADDGQGIPDDMLPHMFHRFVKGKSGETGLGLAIARAIVEQSGGHITASNAEKGGAIFTITFPNPNSLL